jgi:hypothetical protein
MGSFLEIVEVVKLSGVLFSMLKVLCSVWQKMGWATFWAIFSQTHLVTLLLVTLASRHWK